MNEEGKKRILIADDNQDICELVEILLTAEGFEVVQAKNGQEAVDRTDDSIDLIILDVMMPQKSGYKACSEIREKTRVPILFLTAKDQDSDKVMGFSVGGDDYLSKPFSYTELVSRDVYERQIESVMSGALSQKLQEEILSQIPLKRYGTPQDVADLTVFLAGDKSSYMTGQVFSIDGGMSI